jgi:hypothetical protein
MSCLRGCSAVDVFPIREKSHGLALISHWAAWERPIYNKSHNCETPANSAGLCITSGGAPRRGNQWRNRDQLDSRCLDFAQKIKLCDRLPQTPRTKLGRSIRLLGTSCLSFPCKISANWPSPPGGRLGGLNRRVPTLIPWRISYSAVYLPTADK